MNSSIKAITLLQPWATLAMLRDPKWRKRNETRSWAPSEEVGRLAIHAGKNPKYLDLARQEPFRSALHSEGIEAISQLPLGAVIGFVLKLHPVQIPAWGVEMPEPEASFGDYSPGRFYWELQGAIPLAKPIPSRGYHNIWTWTPPPCEWCAKGRELRRLDYFTGQASETGIFCHACEDSWWPCLNRLRE